MVMHALARTRLSLFLFSITTSSAVYAEDLITVLGPRAYEIPVRETQPKPIVIKTLARRTNDSTNKGIVFKVSDVRLADRSEAMEWPRS
jgi:hypothetical protein